jgi:hypothetical protein
MLEYVYPRIDEQRSEHGEFLHDVCEFKTRLKNDGLTH